MDERTRVVIVEDEPDLSTLYASWLREEYDVETAEDGAVALEVIDEDVDVVLLDRRLPESSGTGVLEGLADRGLDPHVAMVTAVEPDFEIVELGIDDYLVKPITKPELHAVVEQLTLRSTYDDQLQEFFALASKKAVLDAQKSTAERKASQEYAALEDRLAVLRTRVDDTVTELIEQDDYRRFCREVTREAIAPDGDPSG